MQLRSYSPQQKHVKDYYKGSKSQSSVINRLIRLDSGQVSTQQNSSYGFHIQSLHLSEENRSGFDENKTLSRNESCMNIRPKNHFDTFIGNIRRNSSPFKLIHLKESHRIDSSKNVTSEGTIEPQFKKIDKNIPPRISRLLHAVEDRSTKQSKELLLTFTRKKKEKQYMMPHKFSLDDFTLQRTSNNIPQIKGLVCHYINSHKKYANKGIVKLPEYEKSAPFFIDSMTFADKYLDDQKIVKKNFGYDEECLTKNNLVLERILLERLIRKEKSIPDKKSIPQLSSLKYIHL